MITAATWDKHNYTRASNGVPFNFAAVLPLCARFLPPVTFNSNHTTSVFRLRVGKKRKSVFYIQPPSLSRGFCVGVITARWPTRLSTRHCSRLIPPSISEGPSPLRELCLSMLITGQVRETKLFDDSNGAGLGRFLPCLCVFVPAAL